MAPPGAPSRNHSYLHSITITVISFNKRNSIFSVVFPIKTSPFPPLTGSLIFDIWTRIIGTILKSEKLFYMVSTAEVLILSGHDILSIHTIKQLLLIIAFNFDRC